jgi:DNA-binding LacI/PurR family transcriptional regulator
MIKREKRVENNRKPVTLKALAECVGLAAGTISSILNRAPQSRAIPQQTRDRVFAAALKMNYRPNPFARALRRRQMPGGNAKPAAGSRVLVFEGTEQFLRAVDAMRQAGLNVPGDVAVAGADDVSAMS